MSSTFSKFQKNGKWGQKSKTEDKEQCICCFEKLYLRFFGFCCFKTIFAINYYKHLFITWFLSLANFYSLITQRNSKVNMRHHSDSFGNQPPCHTNTHMRAHIQCFVGSYSESHLACKVAVLSVNTVKGDSDCMKQRECTWMPIRQMSWQEHKASIPCDLLDRNQFTLVPSQTENYGVISHVNT